MTPIVSFRASPPSHTSDVVIKYSCHKYDVIHDSVFHNKLKLITPSSQITDFYTFRQGAIKSLCRVLSLETIFIVGWLYEDYDIAHRVFIKTVHGRELHAPISVFHWDRLWETTKLNKNWIFLQHWLFKTIEVRFKLNTFQGSHGYHLHQEFITTTWFIHFLHACSKQFEADGKRHCCLN